MVRALTVASAEVLTAMSDSGGSDKSNSDGGGRNGDNSDDDDNDGDDGDNGDDKDDECSGRGKTSLQWRRRQTQ